MESSYLKIIMLSKFVFAFGVLILSLINVGIASAEERDKTKSLIVPHIMACGADFGVTEAEIRTAAESGSLGTIDPCFLACFFKKTKLIDDQGLFDVGKAEEMTTMYFADAAHQKKVLDIISTCKAVNEREVSDTEKGCERAGFLFDCFMSFKDTLMN